MDVGLELRQARERRGMSLQQISHNTKISLRVLQAIEAFDHAALPARVFTRSFVKTFANEVGLDPDSTVRRYLEQIEQLEPAAEPEIEHAAPETPQAAVARDALLMPALLTARLVRGRFGTAIVLVLTGLTAVVLAVREGRRGQSSETPKPAASARIVSTKGTASAETASTSLGTSGKSGASGISGASDTSRTTPAPPDTLRLAIAPTGPCWVQATVGNEHVLAKLLNAGDRREVDTRSDVTLRVGDPAAFAFSINGKPARVPGLSGQAVTVHLTKENYSQFVVR